MRTLLRSPRLPRFLLALMLGLAACSSARQDAGPPVHAAYGAPVLLWKNGGCAASGCDTGWYGSPTVVDLDGDGRPEVVWGSKDLDGDGQLEIAVGRGGDELTVYSATGAPRWTKHPFGAGEVRTLAVADITGSGKLAVVVGRASGGDTKQLSAYAADGALLPGWPARRDGEPGNGWAMYNQNVAIGDLDGDGRPEIVGPTDTHYITVLDGGGNQLA